MTGQDSVVARPICPECYRIGTGHPKYELLDDEHVVVLMCYDDIDGVWRCPQCGFECLPPEEPKCRRCGRPATSKGQLCDYCAFETRWNVITPVELAAFEEEVPYHVIDHIMYFEDPTIDWAAREYEYHERWLGDEM